MNVSDQLLDKYFKGQCSPEEKLLVLNYLNDIDDLPVHLLSKVEWDETNDAILDEQKTEEMFKVVKRKTIVKTYPLKWMKIISAAAIILVVLSIGFLSIHKDTPTVKLADNQVLKTEKQNLINWKSIVNYTDHQQVMQLPDGSTARLFPGAELRYAIPFVKNKREVYLNGKSFFDVSKDQSHPFVVYAKGISTTALGTSFTVTALNNSKFIKIQLHTGKVLVKKEDSISRFTEVLTPGKELVYNSIKNKVSVSDFGPFRTKPVNLIKELNFQQASLVDVFDQLEKHYKVNINYDRADLAEMSFTGSIKLTQSIDTILEEIAELNKLNQIKTANGYLIRK